MAYNSLPNYGGITDPMWQNYGSNNAVQQQQYGQAAGALAQPLDFSGAPAMPQADQQNRDQTTNAVYDQQARYLDPQYQQGQSDLNSQLANQGIMQGSDAWNRAQNNFSLQKTAAYGDARDRAIQQGGAEQTRLFGLGLQARNQGINETMARRNAPLQNLQALNGIGDTYAKNLFGAQNATYGAQVGNQNANAAQSAQWKNGLFSLGSAALNNPDAVAKGWNYVSGMFG